MFSSSYIAFWKSPANFQVSGSFAVSGLVKAGSITFAASSGLLFKDLASLTALTCADA